MPELVSHNRPPLRLFLARDLLRTVRSGHPWIFREALRETPPALPGSAVDLAAPDGRRTIASGFYDPHSPLAVRVCLPGGAGALNDEWAGHRLETAVRWREQCIPAETTGYRLVNGEGDGLPGLVVDRYGDTVVLQFDGAGPEGFWNAAGIARWLLERLALSHAVAHSRDGNVQVLIGDPPAAPEFLERSLRLTADVRHGQKTGFFLDQRENRKQVRDIARGCTVFNLFSYTGGFSVAAGVGGAVEVMSVDSAQPALDVGDRHWTMNGLPPVAHRSLCGDVFEFLEQAVRNQDRRQLVIVDPPSFASSAKNVERARGAYLRLLSQAARVVSEGGVLAAASCSSHVGAEDFLEFCRTALSQARRRARVVSINSQPCDHPWPVACPELRYLKFVLLRLD